MKTSKHQFYLRFLVICLTAVVTSVSGLTTGTVDSLLTNDVTPPLSGTIDDPSATIQVTVNSQTIEGINLGTGFWILPDNLLSPLPDGLYDVVLEMTDTLGNVSFDLTLNELFINTNTSMISVDFLTTTDNTPELSGSVSDINSSINLSVGGQFVAALNNGDGTWTLPDNTLLPLVDGQYSVTATAQDAFGNISVDTSFSELQIDATAPVVTVKSIFSKDNTPGLTGTIDDEIATVEIQVDTQVVSAFNLGNGKWILDENILNILADGVYDVIVRGTDTLGNTGLDSTVDELTIDINDAPKFANIPDTLTTFQGERFTFLPELIDADSLDVLSVSMESENNPWVNLIENGLEGTPRNQHVGTYHFTLILTDDILSDTASLVLKVLNVNDAPAFDIRPDTMEVREGELFALNLEAHDIDEGDSIFYSFTGADWLTLTNNKLFGVPENKDIGHSDVLVLASDGQDSDSLIIPISVLKRNDPPELFSTENLNDTLQIWKEDRIDTFSVVIVETDPADDITLDFELLPDYIRHLETHSADSLFTFVFAALPLQKDTGRGEFTLSFLDIEDDVVDLEVFVDIEETNDPPRAVLFKKNINGGAARLELRIEDEDGYLFETRFIYSLYNGHDFAVKPDSSGTPDSLAEADSLGLPDSLEVAETMVHLTSLIKTDTVGKPEIDLYPLLDGQYTVTIQALDAFGSIQADTTRTEFQITGINEYTLDSAVWDMPGILKARLLVDSLGAGGNIAKWEDNSLGSSLYSKYQVEDIVSLVRGQSYWIQPDNEVTFTVAYDELLQSPQELNLFNGGTGWNQIANPFPYPVDVSESGLTFFEWNPDSADIVDVNGILQPWRGYWVQVDRDMIITIEDKPYFGDTKLLSKKAQFKNINHWTGKMTLKSGNFTDNSNFFGLRTKGHSIKNLSEPPKMGRHISLYFTNPDYGNHYNRFTTAYKTARDTEEVWFDFAVKSEDVDSKNAELVLEGLGSLRQNGRFIFLINKAGAVEIDESNKLAISVTGRENHYSLVITPDPDFALNLTTKFTLSQNFPNPVHTSTTFKFQLPQSYNEMGQRFSGAIPVRIFIYNIKGTLLFEIPLKNIYPGKQQIFWKRPANLQSGTYLYRVEAAGFSVTRKMLVLP